MSPFELLAILDDVIGVAKRTKKRRKDLVLDLIGSPTVLGETGLPTDQPGEYRFTLRQARRMRKTILRAARGDVRGVARW